MERMLDSSSERQLLLLPVWVGMCSKILIMTPLGGKQHGASHRGLIPEGGIVTAATYETLIRRLGILRVAVSKDSSGSFGLTEH
jgi:hypothetical protein